MGGQLRKITIRKRFDHDIPQHERKRFDYDIPQHEMNMEHEHDIDDNNIVCI